MSEIGKNKMVFGIAVAYITKRYFNNFYASMSGDEAYAKVVSLANEFFDEVSALEGEADYSPTTIRANVHEWIDDRLFGIADETQITHRSVGIVPPSHITTEDIIEAMESMPDIQPRETVLHVNRSTYAYDVYLDAYMEDLRAEREEDECSD